MSSLFTMAGGFTSPLHHEVIRSSLIYENCGESIGGQIYESVGTRDIH